MLEKTHFDSGFSPHFTYWKNCMVSINPMQTKRFETEEAECRNQYYKISLKKDKFFKYF
jgi:hypothetical protein